MRHVTSLSILNTRISLSAYAENTDHNEHPLLCSLQALTKTLFRSTADDPSEKVSRAFLETELSRVEESTSGSEQLTRHARHTRAGLLTTDDLKKRMRERAQDVRKLSTAIAMGNANKEDLGVLQEWLSLFYNYLTDLETEETHEDHCFG